MRDKDLDPPDDELYERLAEEFEESENRPPTEEELSNLVEVFKDDQECDEADDQIDREDDFDPNDEVPY